MVSVFSNVGILTYKNQLHTQKKFNKYLLDGNDRMKLNGQNHICNQKHISAQGRVYRVFKARSWLLPCNGLHYQHETVTPSWKMLLEYTWLDGTHPWITVMVLSGVQERWAYPALLVTFQWVLVALTMCWWHSQCIGGTRNVLVTLAMCWWHSQCVGGTRNVLVTRTMCWWHSQCVGGTRNVLVTLTMCWWHSQCVGGTRNVLVALAMCWWHSQCVGDTHNELVALTMCWWHSQCIGDTHKYNKIHTAIDQVNAIKYIQE